MTELGRTVVSGRAANGSANDGTDHGADNLLPRTQNVAPSIVYRSSGSGLNYGFCGPCTNPYATDGCRDADSLPLRAVYDEKQVKLRLLPTLREEMSNVILGRLLTLLVDTCIPGVPTPARRSMRRVDASVALSDCLRKRGSRKPGAIARDILLIG